MKNFNRYIVPRVEFSIFLITMKTNIVYLFAIHMNSISASLVLT